MEHTTPHYKTATRVSELPEGYEFQPNRFVAKKSKKGCYISYNSQDGSVKMIKDPKSNTFNLWLEAGQYVDCVMDFVPDNYRNSWEKLEALGKCKLIYDPEADIWMVYYYENETQNRNLGDAVGKTQGEAIKKAVENLRSTGIVYNGYRWFDCREYEMRKISDEEAAKLKEAHETNN